MGRNLQSMIINAGTTEKMFIGILLTGAEAGQNSHSKMGEQTETQPLP